MSHSNPLFRTRCAAVAAAALLLASACSNDRASKPPVDLGGVQLVAALEPFDACDDFLAYVHEQAADQVGPYGLDGSGGGVIAFGGDVVTSREAGAPNTTMASDGFAEDDAVAPSASTTESAKSSDSGAGTDGTGTNNQEVGVDEADIVKTDGTRIVTVRGSQLVVVTMTEGAPYKTATVDLGSGFYGDKLFLLPDRAYVLGNDDSLMNSGGDDPGIAEGEMNPSSYYMPSAAVVEVSLGDTPAVTGKRAIEGMLLDGRMTNGALRLVVSTPGGSGLGFVYPSGGDQRSEDRAEEANRSVVAESTLDDWLPDVIDGNGERSPLLDCDHLYRPAEVSGFSMLSILTISDGLGSLTGTGVLADGQITYASTDELYVATNAWADPADNGDDIAIKRAAVAAEHTDVHAFSIAGTEPAVYEASGRVDGHVLNQYSMSESDGNLRIATTTNATFAPSDCPADAYCTDEAQIAEEGDSQIVVLARKGDSLVELGKVDGLGVSEQIKSVRYVDDLAYVVTFRQTDPFYVVDLSDPSAPKKLGELKVPGFSSYLHPVGAGLVLGVGSDATDEGRITGAKLSLYRTTDPLNPTEVATWTSKDLGFMAGDDPHAFSWDADRQTAYLPYYASCWDEFGNCSTTDNGVLVVKVTADGIAEIGRITHADRTPSPDPVPGTTTTVPETTVPETTVPATTVPETTVPETTVPDSTTIPTTTIVTDSGRGSSSSSSSGATEPAPDVKEGPVPEPLPMPIDPICDPSFCDPGPVGTYLPTITRVFVIGDRIITLSDAGIAAHDVTTLKLTGFAAF